MDRRREKDRFRICNSKTLVYIHSLSKQNDDIQVLKFGTMKAIANIGKD